MLTATALEDPTLQTPEVHEKVSTCMCHVLAPESASAIKRNELWAYTAT